MLQPERRKPSGASLNFHHSEDDICIELGCAHCPAILRFSRHARPAEMEKEMFRHNCLKPALEVDLEMFQLVRCPVCGGEGCGSCSRFGTVLFPRSIS